MSFGIRRLSVYSASSTRRVPDAWKLPKQLSTVSATGSPGLPSPEALTKSYVAVVAKPIY